MRTFGSRVIAGVAIAVLALTCNAIPRNADMSSYRRVSATTADPNAEEIMQDMDTAVQVVNAFWTRHWSEYFTGTYTPPRVEGLYDGSKPGAPTCGDKVLESDNAYYCPNGHFVAWDVKLMSRGITFGDGWIYLAVAHEWGHAIQAQLSSELQSVERELQADCLAGAALYGAAKDGTLQFEAGDVEEITHGLTVAADNAPWTRSGDHGNAQQRIQAFSRGSNGSVPACLPTS